MGGGRDSAFKTRACNLLSVFMELAKLALIGANWEDRGFACANGNAASQEGSLKFKNLFEF